LQPPFAPVRGARGPVCVQVDSARVLAAGVRL
jgi:hypothetical protein